MRIALALSLASLSLLAGCNDPKEPPTTPPATSSATAAASAAVANTPAATAAVPTTSELTVGKPPPDFSVKAHDGTDLKLSALKGKPVVVYFYPKDETPGCTKEACSFRDAWKDLGKANVVLIGVSTDTDESHKSFAKSHELPFQLVSDAKGTIAKSFGVPNNGGFLGRQTFVIGADGNVKKIYREVDVTSHAQQVLADIK